MGWPLRGKYCFGIVAFIRFPTPPARRTTDTLPSATDPPSAGADWHRIVAPRTPRTATLANANDAREVLPAAVKLHAPLVRAMVRTAALGLRAADGRRHWGEVRRILTQYSIRLD